MRRVLVFGGRDFTDTKAVFNSLDLMAEWSESDDIGNTMPMLHIISGCASGADQLGLDWAKDTGNTTSEFPAAWQDLEAPGAIIKTRRDGIQYNTLAGFWRNQQMIDEGHPDIGLMFPGRNGTRDMKERLIKAKIPIVNGVVYD